MADKTKSLVCIAGKSGSGKSTSLRNLKGKVLYVNCEAGKRLTFKHDFTEVVLTDPLELFEILDDAEAEGFETVVIDSLTFLLEMYESLYIYESKDGFGVWNDFQQYAKRLFTDYVPSSAMSFVFLAHVAPVEDKETGETEIAIPVKGALAKNGLEAYFSLIVMALKMPTSKLKDANDLLTITPREQRAGFKYVFQTQITKTTTNTRIRGPWDFWEESEVYIDNDAQMLIDLVNEHDNG